MFQALRQMLIDLFSMVSVGINGLARYMNAFASTGEYTERAAQLLNDRAAVKNAAEIAELSKQLKNI